MSFKSIIRSLLIFLKLQVLLFSASFFEFVGNQSYLPPTWVSVLLLFLTALYLLYRTYQNPLLKKPLNIAMLLFLVSFFAVELFLNRDFIFSALLTVFKDHPLSYVSILVVSMVLIVERRSFQLLDPDHPGAQLQDQIIDYAKPENKGNSILSSNYRFFYPHVQNINRVYGDIKYTYNNVSGSSFGYDVYDYNKLNVVTKTILKDIQAISLDDKSAGLKNIHSLGLEKLEYILLQQTDAIPPRIFDLEHLKVLILESKEITQIPDRIGELSSLKVLVISSGDNIQYLTPKLTQLHQLQQLYLRRLHLIKNYKIDFSNFKDLEILEIYDSDSGLLNTSITGCRKLSQLYVNQYETYLSELPRLKLLSIDTLEEESQLAEMSTLNLEELAIVNYRAKNFSSYFSDFKRLRNLFLSFGTTRVQFPTEPVFMSNLECLSISSKFPIAISSLEMPNLRYLLLHSSDKNNPIIVSAQFNRFKNLKYILIRGNYYQVNTREKLHFSVVIKTGLWFEDKFKFLYKAPDKREIG